MASSHWNLNRKSVCSLTVAALFGFLMGGTVQAQTVEEVEKKLVDAHGKMKSYTSKTKTVQNFDMSGMKMTSDYGGTVEWKREGDKQKFRTEMKGSTTMGDQPKMEMSVLMISDGEFLHTVQTQMGQTSAMKQKPDTSATGDPKKLFEKIRSDNNVKIMPDAKVDGMDTYVLEVVPKTADGGPVAKSMMYFAKDTGINVKIVGFDKDGKEVFTNTTSDIKLNTEIPSDRFVFKAPEGVQVMDMTKATP